MNNQYAGQAPAARLPARQSPGTNSQTHSLFQSLLFILALWLPAQACLAATPCEQPFELSSSGRYLADACGNRFKMKSVNWYGGSDTWHVPIGLEKQSIAHIAGLIRQMGFNSVRLPFSNQAIHVTAPVNPAYVTANAELIGKTPLQVYDAVVKGLTDAGIVVVLNNHTTSSEWCCNYDDNGLWWTNWTYPQSTAQWQADWAFMANRYSSNPLVAAADLRNEVRTMNGNGDLDPISPKWADRGGNDWRKAATNAGNAIVRANPKMLVIVEGINFTGMTAALGAYRPHLQPVYNDPVGLIKPGKLMYAAHNYGYIGPKATGGSSFVDGPNPVLYRDMSKTSFYDTLNKEFGYVANPDKTYSAPVWVSEFGVGFDGASAADQTWFANLTSYLADNDLDFAYWALNGTKTDSIEGYGLLTEDWSAPRTDWRTPHLNALLNAPEKTGPITGAKFTAPDYGPEDDNQSASLGDWASGATKATCPDGYHVAGASRYDRWNNTGRFRILCTNQVYGNLRSAGEPTSVQGPWESSRYRGYDWAGGFTKYECPKGYFVSGAAKLWWGTSHILCAKANRPLGNTCRTLWFDRWDTRYSSKGGDFAPGAIKGQGADDEYVAGIAQRDGNAASILVCK